MRQLHVETSQVLRDRVIRVSLRRVSLYDIGRELAGFILSTLYMYRQYCKQNLVRKLKVYTIKKYTTDHVMTLFHPLCCEAVVITYCTYSTHYVHMYIVQRNIVANKRLSLYLWQIHTA